MLNRRVLVYSEADPFDATFQIRIEGPLRTRGIEIVHADALRHVAEGRFRLDDSFDAILVHRAVKKRDMKFYTSVLSAARERRIPIIYDTDDLLIEVHPAHPDYSVYRARAVYAIKALIDADFVVAATPELAKRLSALHSQVVVIPNELPRELWNATCRQRLGANTTANGDSVTIGYIGTSTHAADLASVEASLVSVLENRSECVRFVSVGVPLPPRLKRHPRAQEIIPPKSIRRRYPEFAAYAPTLHLDVGIAPLCDTPFNRCKSDIKRQEYAALAIAGVYVDMDPYQTAVLDGENGLLAVSAEQWIAQLTRLVTSPNLRRRLAHHASQEQTKLWKNGRSGEQWEDLIERTAFAMRENKPTTSHPLATFFDEMISYQVGLEHRLKRTVEYQVSNAFSRIVKKWVA